MTHKTREAMLGGKAIAHVGGESGMRGLWVGGLLWVLGATGAIALPQPVRSPLQLAQASADSPQKQEADRLRQQGNQQYDAGQFREALQSWEAALQLYRNLQDQAGEAKTLNSLGAAHQSLGQSQQAINFYEQSLAITRAIGDQEVAVKTLVNLGSTYFHLGQYQRVIEFYQQSLAIQRAISDRNGEANSLMGLGVAYFALGQYQRAIENYEQSLAIQRAIGDRNGEANPLMGLGFAYFALGQYQRAIEFHEQSLAITRAIGDRKGEANSLMGLGNAYFSLGQYQRAIENYEQSLAITRVIGDRKGEADSLHNLGVAYESLRQYQRAIENCEQALAIRRAIGDRNGESSSLNNLGNAYQSLGQYQRAIEFHEQSLAIKRAIGDRQGEAASLTNLGIAYDSLGQYQRAIEFHEQSLAIDREIGDRQGEAASLSGLGNAYQSLGQYQRAIENYEQCLAIQRVIGNREGEAASLGNLGVAYKSLGQYQRAIEFHEQSLAITRAIGDREGEATSLNNLGLTHLVTNRLADSAVAFQSSLDMLELIQKDVGRNDRDRTSFLETQQKTYQGLQRTLIAMNQSAKALEIADRGRARSLLSFLRPETQAANKPLTAAEMQAIAQQQNGTIVHYSVVLGELYIWVVPPTGEIGFRKVPLPGSANDLAQTATDLRNSAVTLPLMTTRGDNQQLASFANQLRGDGEQPVTANLTDLRQGYDLLIKPIADLLPTETGSKIIIIPHRELAVVPFAALRDEEGKFLIDRHTLAFAPSVSVLAEATRRPKTSNGPALIVGNPAPMPEHTTVLKPLPGAENEAQAIAQTLKAQPLIGSQATEAQVKDQIDRASLLHFATHGIISPTAAGELDSWLALTPGSNDDGKLTIAEIFDRQLSARLAVLSACDTGRGAVSGEGVIGLARAFLKAGVPTVVASLWKVPDEPTAMMMQAFYAERAAGKDAATALRSAMLQVKEQYPGPQNWAAFVAIGDTISPTP